MGNFFKAAQAALTKKLMKPRRTPCSFSNFSPYFLRSSMTAAMLTSLKVVSMAFSFFDCSRRSAMRLRSLVMGTRCSGRSPLTATGGTTGAAATAGLAAAGWAASASSLVIRPPRPVPATLSGATPFSSRILRAAGLATAAVAAAWAAGWAVGAGAAAAAGSPADGLASVSIWAITSPEVTGAPSPLRIFTSTPSAGAGVSSTTLSVSISTRFSSRRTNSPSFLCQATSEASATDSDSCGTFTSINISFS